MKDNAEEKGGRHISKRIHIRDTHQTTEVVVEGDCIALEVFYGNSREIDPDSPDERLIYELEESVWLSLALNQALTDAIGMSIDAYSCTRGECGEDCPRRPNCGNKDGSVEHQ